MKVTIRNSFHGTECTVKVSEEGKLSKSQIRRIRKNLCGIDTCTCGGNLSERGPQEVEIEIYGRDDFRVRPIREE